MIQSLNPARKDGVARWPTKDQVPVPLTRKDFGGRVRMEERPFRMLELLFRVATLAAALPGANVGNAQCERHKHLVALRADIGPEVVASDFADPREEARIRDRIRGQLCPDLIEI